MTGDGHGKRRRSHPARWPARRGSPVVPSRGDDEGLIVDWLGIQATGGGGASTASGIGCVFALTAIRAAPHLMRRLVGGREASPKPPPAPGGRR
jgi:hypothetical protein